VSGTATGVAGPAPATTSVLYDVPGPRARRVTRVASVLAVIAVALLGYLLVVRPLLTRGQFSAAKWGPLLDPANESFGPLWTRLATGLGATAAAAAVAIVTSLACGTLLALLRVQLKELRRRRFTGVPRLLALGLRALSWSLNLITRVFVETFRGLPAVITIFFVGRGLPEYGISFDNPMWYVVAGLTIYNMVVIAEVLRSGMELLPAGQREAAASLGLSGPQTATVILLPQAFRIMFPALVSQLVVIVKDTSLGFIVSYEELLNVATQATQVLSNPIQLYAAVGLIYVVINYVLSKLATGVQRRLTGGARRPSRRREAGAVRTDPGEDREVAPDGLH
jgi:glutamate transport system permease protein